MRLSERDLSFSDPMTCIHPSRVFPRSNHVHHFWYKAAVTLVHGLNPDIQWKV